MMDVVMDDQENVTPNSLPNSLDAKKGSSFKAKAVSDVNMDISQSPETLALIRQQLEFYLSDANLYNDPYLRNILTEKREQKVPFDVLLGFSKLR